MISLLHESLFILLLSYQAVCSVWPNNKPKLTSSYLPPAVQILHVQTERLNDIRSSTSTTTEAITTTSAVTCRPQTEDEGEECHTYSGPPEAAPVLGVQLIAELDGELNVTTPISVLAEVEVTQSETNVTVNSTFYQTVADQLADQLTHDSQEETRITASTGEKESNSTSNKEDEENLDILAPILLLERLRDILTADAKRQGLSKVQGYSEELLELLSISSTYSSRNQLRIVLIRMLKRGDAERRDSILMTKKIIEKLKDPEGPLSSALKLIPPLMFTY